MTPEHEEAVRLAAFLDGSAPHPETGKWFNEYDDEALASTPKRRYWWRKFLPVLIADVRRQNVSELPCHKCGGEVVEFSVPNDLWNTVMRPDGKEHDGEYICIGCWHDAIRARLEEGK